MLARHGLERREKALGPDNPDTLTSVSQVAQILDARGNPTEAEPLYRWATDGLAHTVGKQQAAWMEAAFACARFLQKQGREAEAASLAKEVADNARQALPEASPERRKYEAGLSSKPGEPSVILDGRRRSKPN